VAKGVLCAETAEARLILSWAVGDRAWTDAQLCGSARNWCERWRSAPWGPVCSARARCGDAIREYESRAHAQVRSMRSALPWHQQEGHTSLVQACSCAETGW